MTRDPLYCSETQPCAAAGNDPSLNFCDIEGTYPASQGHGHTCIPSPFDGGLPDAPQGADAMPVPDAPPGSHLVAVTTVGPGAVSSMPAGIDCGSTCVAPFVDGIPVTLAATPSAGSSLTGWSGDCDGCGVCGFTVDADKSVTAEFSAPGETFFVKGVGGVGSERARAVDVSPVGDFVLAGDFSGEVMIGGSTLTSAAGSEDILVAKFTQNGTVTWAKRFGAAGADSAMQAYAAGGGDVIVVGLFNGTVDFGGTTLTSDANGDVFVLRLSGGTGDKVWVVALSGTGAPELRGGDLDPAGDLVVAGSFTGTIDFGGQSLTANGTDAFVAKYAGADGARLWAVRFGAAGADIAWDCAVDGGGNVAFTGSFQSTVMFGTTSVTSQMSSPDIFVAKLSGTNGNALWAQSFGSPGTGFGGIDGGLAIATNSLGEIAVGGTHSGPMTIGTSMLMPVGSSAMFIARFTAAGAPVWSRSLDVPLASLDMRMTSDPGGDVYVSGSFTGTIDLGGGAFTVAGSSSDVFLVKYASADGAHLWSERFGGTGIDVQYDLTTGPCNDVALAGGFNGFAEFGALNLTSAGGDDMFGARIAR